MKVQVRRGLFETNSSSTHSITMCSESDFDMWRRGERVYDDYKEELVPPTDKTEGDSRYYSFERFFDGYRYETYSQSFTTEKGEKVIAFGYYGYDS